MSDLLKRVLIGAAIGLVVGIIVGWGTYQVGFVNDLLDGYEFQSFDARMRAKVTGVEEQSIDDVVIIDIEQESVRPVEEGGLGRYYNWPQAYHGKLIDVVTSSLQLFWSRPEGDVPPDYYQVFRQVQNDSEAQFEYLGDAYDIMWTYDAWIEISYVAGEIKDPGRNIPKASLLSMVVIIAIYVLANGVFISALSIEKMAGSALVASDAAEVYLGSSGASIIALAILICTLGANNANVLTSARITYAMAKEKLFFRSVSKIHSKTETPATALIIQGIWATFLTFTGSFNQLITYMIFASWIFYGMSAGAVIILRHQKPGMKRPYRVWGYPWVPAIFILFAAWLTVNTIIEAPRDAAIGIGLILTGLPFYFFWSSRKGSNETD